MTNFGGVTVDQSVASALQQPDPGCTRLSHCSDSHLHSAQAIMQSIWAACPPDVLQRCMSAQLDYNDNAAAACVCRLWRGTFRSGGRAFNLAFGKLRSPPTPLPLHQFTGVSGITLKGWPVEFFGIMYDRYRDSSWIEPLKSIPATCTSLNLDRYLPSSPKDFQNILGSLSQLSSLQQLNLQFEHSVQFPLEALSIFKNLQALGLSCRPYCYRLFLDGTLEALPRSITRLQLSNCRKDTGQPALMLRDLTHLKLLRDLDLSYSVAALGSSGLHAILKEEEAQPAASCASAGLCTQLTRLVLTDAKLVMDAALELLAFSALRVLCLHGAIIRSDFDTMNLKDLVHSMRHLVELDIRACDKVDMSPPDCEEVRLSCLSFDHQQLYYHDKAWLNHFVVHEQDSESMFKPFLRMECGEHTSQCDVQRWTVEAPFCLLTHLTICNAGEWPGVFDFLTDLHQLQVLDLRFLTEFHQISSPSCSVETIVSLNSTAKLTELFIAHGSYTRYNLAQCTTLSVLGLIQQKGKKPALHLPPSLTKLYLYNILSASTDLGLDTLSDLTSIQLGGKVTGTDATQQLPPLPPSVLELDLWDGVFTDLQQLTRLTNLKKLTMPDQPTEQQLHVMRQLRQLRHLEQTPRTGVTVENEQLQADLWLRHLSSVYACRPAHVPTAVLAWCPMGRPVERSKKMRSSS